MTGQVWALSDGAAGNRRQARALARALDLGPVREWRLESRAPWRWLAPGVLPGAGRAFGPAFAAALAAPPRLAVGCGRQAALATRLLRGRGARVVQILDPRRAPRHWDALVVPQHDRVRAGNVITTLGSLNEIDDAWLGAGAAAFPALAAAPAPRTLLLLGGPIAGLRLDGDWWRRLAGILEHWLEHGGGSLLVSGSRRTPAWLAAAVRTRFAGRATRLWFDAGDGENPYAGLLAAADRIIVSPDSVNLVSEACATAVPVFVAADFDRGDAGSGRHRSFLRALIESGRVRPLQVDAPGWPVTPLRELPRVAAELRARLGL